MRNRLRAILTLLLFLLFLGLAVATHSAHVDASILVLVWIGFAVGSLILLIKNFNSNNSARNQPAMYIGQVSFLPESWRRWILDEKNSQSRSAVDPKH